MSSPPSYQKTPGFLTDSFFPGTQSHSSLRDFAGPIVGPDLFYPHPYPTPFPAEEEEDHSGRLTTFLVRLTEEKESDAFYDRKIKQPFDLQSPLPPRDLIGYDPDLAEFERVRINPFHRENPYHY